MSDHKELLKHSRNYLFANIATKALAFISIPVYTRLLSVEDYGIVNVYISVIMIAPILMTLNTEVAIARYYFDSKDIDDFKEFVCCSIKVSSIVFFVISILLITIVPWISMLLSFSCLLTLTIIPVSLYKITNSVFTQIYNPIMESKKIAIVSSIQAYLAFGLSVLAIILLPSNKYYGYVIGNVLAMIMLGIYLYNQIKPYYKKSFRSDHIKYLLNYCIPYLPYSLSGVIIAQFGKIFISSESGFDNAGLYSFASNISLVIMVFIGLIHQAWNPFYFRYMNEKDYKSIDNDYDLIWRITLLLGVFVCIFSHEIGLVMGKDEYLPSLRILPYLVLGYVFYQLAFVYMRNTGYAKKTIWNGIVVVISGIFNIILNYYLIPTYNEMGAALSFMFSYILLFLLSWIINIYILRVYAPKIIKFAFPFAITFPFYFVSLYLDDYSLNFVYLYIFKISISIIVFLLLTFQYRYNFIQLYNRIIRK